MKTYVLLLYDRKNNTILIPLISSDGRVTKSKIQYKFGGKYFEKI
ncbi:hypothetical protein [Pedobacter sp. MC2016-24]|nr:hypothetical protein [Pedobacter sp. MC2016-24]